MVAANMPRKKLEESLRNYLQKKFPQIEFPEIILEEPKNPEFGDYSCTLALKISNIQGGSPRKIAEEIISDFKPPVEFLTPTIAGAGFINFSFSPEFLSTFLEHALSQKENFGKLPLGKGKTIVTDISHPNIAKPMGVHHLLSTVIGDTLNRLFTFLGYKVIRDNYLGDWGTQFGKLIYAYRTWGDKKVVEKNPIPELLKLYVKFHDEAEKNPLLEEEGRKEFKKLEEGDGENRKTWEWIVEVSLKEFKKIWDLLGVKFDVIHGESFYEDKMEAILALGMKSGIFHEGEKGALICEFSEEGYPPAVVRKADGATLYATRDLARIKYWEDTWHPDFMITVVDSAQKLHFQQLISMAKELGLTDAMNVHILFGRMSFPDRRMSTRKGNIILLEEVIDEIEVLARKIVEEKNSGLSEEEKGEIARKVGLGALKFAILNQNRESDVKFTWEKMLSFDGESAPYLQYAYARCRSILRKAAEEKSKGEGNKDGEQESAIPSQEIALLRFFPKFSDTLVRCVEEYHPNHLAKYLVKLVNQFSIFYDALPVLKSPPAVRERRLKLVEAVSMVLKNGLALLGIEVSERM